MAGHRPLVSGVGTVLSYLAVAGLIAWLWLPEGRLMLAMLFGALVPFSMTWTVSGAPNGGLPCSRMRFISSRRSGSSRGRTNCTRAASQTATRGRRAAARCSDARRWCSRRRGRPRLVDRVAICSRQRDASRNGDAVMIVAGPRDRWFFADGWSSLVVAGNVTIAICGQPPAQRSGWSCRNPDRTN